MLPAEALRRAMLEFVSGPKSADYPYEDYAYPGVWASFMVVGLAHPAR
jgi:CHAT domain-containing protein